MRRRLFLAAPLLALAGPAAADHRRPAAPPVDACSDAGEALCMPIHFAGEVPTAQDGERLVAFGRALARGSNATVRLEGPGAAAPLAPNAIPTLSQMRAEKVARLLETGGLPWDRIQRVSARRWRVVGP